MKDQPKLLIVDDSAYIQTQLNVIFQQESVELAFASDGLSALSLVESFAPDVILLDIMLPDIEGYDLYDQIKEKDTNHASIIFLTSKNANEDEIKGISKGACDYIKKPFHEEVLKVKVLAHLEMKKKKDELLRKNEEMEQNIKRLNDLAFRDSLTGLYNRHFLNDQVIKEFQSQEGGVLIMGDVDDFKYVNDVYGHEAGDSVLIGIANIMRSASEHLHVIRWGGEEFLMMLFQVNKKEAFALCEQIRKTVEGFPFLTKGTCFHCTLTLGMHAYDLKKDFFTNIEFADKALYRGKRSGKNCSIWADGIY